MWVDKLSWFVYMKSPHKSPATIPHPTHERQALLGKTGWWVCSATRMLSMLRFWLLYPLHWLTLAPPYVVKNHMRRFFYCFWWLIQYARLLKKRFFGTSHVVLSLTPSKFFPTVDSGKSCTLMDNISKFIWIALHFRKWDDLSCVSFYKHC